MPLEVNAVLAARGIGKVVKSGASDLVILRDIDLAVMPGEAQTAKESALSAKTRDRLKEKISLDMKNEMLRDVLKEISGALTDLKKGALSNYPDQGVSLNSRITVKAKEKSVEEILDEALKPLDLGYVIVSKPGDRYDGWLLLKKGSQRGDDTPADGKEKKKDDSKVKEKKEMPEKKEAKADTGGDTEKDATRLLNNAKFYVSSKKPEKAKEVLKELLEKHPNSKAADEAKTLLEKLDK